MTRTRRIILAATAALALGLPATGTIAHAAPASGTAQAAPTTITVVGGDSLAGLAQRYGVRFSALLKANSMTMTSVIHPGDTLVMPAGAMMPATQPSSSTASSATNPAALTTVAASATTYMVKAGDGLAGIAFRNGVRLGALLKANNLTVASVIYPGRSLSIPPATMPIPAPKAAAAPVPVSGQAATVVSPVSVVPAAGGTIGAVLDYLRAQVGVPYRFFSAGPDAFDCSGLVVAGFRQIGIQLPQQSRALALKGDAVDPTTTSIAPGDLVFTSATGDPAKITHVGIALDSRTWVQAIGAGRTVSIGSLPATSKIVAVRRISLP